MEPSVRALFTVCEIDGKTVVSAEIPGVDISERPVFYKGVGRIKGSYVRVGESDEQMSEYEIYSYEAFRKRTRDDIRVVENGKLNLIDEKRMSDYLHAVKSERKNLADNVSEAEILELMGITNECFPTLAETMPVGDSFVEFCSTPRTRAEIVDFVGKSKNHVMSQIVAPLVADGNLKMTIPDKPKSSNQRFVKAR